MAAFLDIPVLEVESHAKQRVQEQVVTDEGPTDRTVIVASADGNTVSDDTLDTILELFGELGQIDLVR